MGQTLSSPATTKHTDSGGDDRYLWAVSEMQGWRITMEDAHTTVLRLQDDSTEDDGNSFFAVYDGHGGGTVARFAGENVHRRLVKEDAYQRQDWQEAMKRAFLGTDEDMLADPAYTRDPSGCTAVATLVTKDGKIYCANAGDSRSVLSVKGEAKPLSYDHKPQNTTERNRVVAAGGYIEFGRVNGNLALARALGDFEYKKNYAISPEAQIITANPDIIEHQITGDDEFLVIACDGIWDCLSSQQVVDVVRLQIAQGKELTEICEGLCDLCLAPDTTSGAGIGCDNMTALVVALLNGKSKEEWYAMVRDRVGRGYGHQTPMEIPQIYPMSRIASFRARRQAQEERERELAGVLGPGGSGRFGDNGVSVSRLGGGPGGLGLSGLARVLGSAGGISFHPGAGILSDAGTLMFEQDDDDDDDGDMDADADPNDVFFAASTGEHGLDDIDEGDEHTHFGLSPRPPPDMTKSLKEQLDELEQLERDGELRFEEADDADEDAFKEPFESVIDLSDAEKDRAESRAARTPTPRLQGEAPSPPLTPSELADTLPNGHADPAQLVSAPGGDAPSAAVKAEGLLDKSEDPLVAA